MTESPAVEFRHVSKRFSLQHSSGPRSFQESLIGLFQRRETARPFWGLHEASFVLEKGKTYGFIGANGAGKSTALKLIARILEPSSGQVLVHGTVGALLELGAGFHHDLTGRENIQLSGSLMGLSRDTMRAKFDEIVAFSELEEFIDMPVKHYSSGMYVRLGFSVAVHMEPEILLIDEVLAVGDASFQHKCIERIERLRRSGITIILVSHGLGTIESLCDEAFWFDRGVIREQGPTTDVLMAYLDAVASEEASKAGGPAGVDPVQAIAGQRGSGKIRIAKVEFLREDEQPSTVFHTGESMTIRLHYRAAEPVANPVFGLAVHHGNGVHICGPNTQFGQLDIPVVDGEGYLDYVVPELSLLQGTYLVSVSAQNALDTETYDYQDRFHQFRVLQGHRQEHYGLVTLGGSWLLHDSDAVPMGQEGVR